MCGKILIQPCPLESWGNAVLTSHSLTSFKPQWPWELWFLFTPSLISTQERYWKMAASERQAYRDGDSLALAPSTQLLFRSSRWLCRSPTAPPLGSLCTTRPAYCRCRFLSLQNGGKGVGQSVGLDTSQVVLVAGAWQVVLFVAEMIPGTILTTCTTIRYASAVGECSAKVLQWLKEWPWILCGADYRLMAVGSSMILICLSLIG